MKALTPAALLKNNRKRKNCLKGEVGYILFCVSEFCAMRVESTPSKDVYVFFILRRRVQRYCTAVRGAKNKKYMHRHHKIICVHNKIYLPKTVHKSIQINGSMKASTPTALLKNNRKRKNCLKGEGGYILFCVSEFCAMRVESTPSKDVYVFFYS